MIDDNIRLNTQHWLRVAHTGYLIHPSIPVNLEDRKEGLKVADVGCGTGYVLYLDSLLGIGLGLEYGPLTF